MKFDTIADIYSANRSVRERLTGALSTVKPDEANARPAGEKWSIQEIVEHLTMVEFGTARICTKLLNEAKNEGKLSNGRIELSAVFTETSATVATQSLEAPDRVYPTGKVTILESFERMAEKIEDIERKALAAAELDADRVVDPKLLSGRWDDLAADANQAYPAICKLCASPELSAPMLAEATAQIFLGVRLECAKCHHHPFEKYSQEDYYAMAAFFARAGAFFRPPPAPCRLARSRSMRSTTSVRSGASTASSAGALPFIRALMIFIRFWRYSSVYCDGSHLSCRFATSVFAISSSGLRISRAGGKL